MTQTRLTLLACACAACIGCGDLGENRRQATGNAGGAGLQGADGQAGNGAPPLPQASASQAAGSQAAQAPPAPGNAPPQPGASPAAEPAPEPEMVRERAAPGVTGKGQYEPGLVTTPIAAYFSARERITFDIQIPHAMQIYEAINGHKPKTQDVFMKEIIETNQIQLPGLPAGHRYVYDPEKGELMVEHPG